MLNWLIISYNLCRNKCEKHNNCRTEEKLHRIYYFAVVNALIGRCNNNLSGYRADYHRYKNVHYHSASLEQALFSFWNIISVRSSKKPCHNKAYTYHKYTADNKNCNLCRFILVNKKLSAPNNYTPCNSCNNRRIIKMFFYHICPSRLK